MNLMLDVTAFGTFRTKKFPARGRFIKKRAPPRLAFQGASAAIAHNVKLAAINDNFGSCDRVRLARSQAKSRDAGDAWQGFAAKIPAWPPLQDQQQTDLARGMPLQGKERVIAIHAAAVIDYANHEFPATNDDSILRAAASMLFSTSSFTLTPGAHDFAGSYLAGYRLRQQSNLTIFVFQSVDSRLLIAKKT